LDHVKRRIVDDPEGRRALWERLQFALDGEPDPWFEAGRAALDTRQFVPIVPAAQTGTGTGTGTATATATGRTASTPEGSAA
ncbi:MAG TPA: hypothetical protein PK929_18050, partial [Quisquiliibacterium sp.]|nr:hypothetical protein [Quisquiliibacterium sp.]